MIEYLEYRFVCSAPSEIHAPLGILIHASPITGTINGTITQQVVGSVDRRLISNRTTEIFSQIGTSQAIFNPSSWISTVDISFASIYNNLSQQRQPLNLINSQFGLAADHYRPAVGSISYFADEAGHVYSRTIVDYRSYTLDLAVVKLDSPLPSSIHPAMLLPSYVSDRAWAYFNVVTGDIPVVAFDQENKTLVSKLSSLGDAATVTTVVPGTNRMAFYEPKIAGDSGHGMFLVYGDKPILISHITGGSSDLTPTADANGPAYHWRLTTIKNAMTAMGGDNNLNIFDLQGAMNKTSVTYTIIKRPNTFNQPSIISSPIKLIFNDLDEIEDNKPINS